MKIFDEIKLRLSKLSQKNKTEKNVHNLKDEMTESISSFMAQYAAEMDGAIENVAYIFARAIQMIDSTSEKDLSMEMRLTGVTPEFGALNILQNFAMVEIEYAPMADIIRGDSDSGPYELYNAINEEKLIRGYISEEQYKENESLGVKLRHVPHHLWMQ